MRVALVTALFALAAGPARAGEIEDAEMGLRVKLPGAGWSAVWTDLRNPAEKIRVYAPPGGMDTALILVRLPGAERHPLAAGHSDARIDLVRLPAGEAQRLEYTEEGSGEEPLRAVALFFRRAGDQLLVKLRAPESRWDENAWREAARAVFESIRLAPPAVPAPVLERSPEQIRTARAAGRARTDAVSVVHHDLRLDVFPDEGRLEVRDRLTVRAREDGVRELALVLTDVAVRSIRLGERDLEWRRDGRNLVVRLPEALAADSRVEIDATFHSADFFVRAPNALVEEVSVFGQVHPGSSFSSHVWYYPTDAVNDATARVTISVPSGYVAVAGGTPREAVPEKGRAVFVTEVADRRPRALPFGFAVGRFERLSVETPSGLVVDVYRPRGSGRDAAAVREQVVATAAFLEETLGELPWRRVAVARVQPVEGIVGVSLPGLVLLSETVVADAPPRTLDDRGLTLADELSHQWNFWASELPNELAEGISTFTDLLVIERASGREAGLAGVRQCARGWLATAETGGDAAVADPAVYARPDCYRAVVFLKTAAALHELREMLGDEAFFDGLRRALRPPAGEDGEPFDRFRRAFEEASGRELDRWLTDRFFRPGGPKLVVTGGPAEGGEPALSLTVRQVQAGAPYAAMLTVEVLGEDGERVRRTVVLGEREETFSLPLPAPPASFVVDPDETSLLRRVAPVVEGR